MAKRLASVSLDLDNKWSYLKSHNDPAWESHPGYLPLIFEQAELASLIPEYTPKQVAPDPLMRTSSAPVSKSAFLAVAISGTIAIAGSSRSLRKDRSSATGGKSTNSLSDIAS